ncbi:MAG: alpha/beta fold hydrolase, partial [Ktedonobacterales bacterium]|nr:alpha/beta fold hydrolase [Ktedonobacterales bacterium]
MWPHSRALLRAGSLAWATMLAVITAPALAHKAQRADTPLPRIVLVHGAWADASSWSGVIERLHKRGYLVSAPQLHLLSLADDVAQVRQVLAEQAGLTILVGHSYGGAVITALGADTRHVVALVYVSAFAPDAGESLQSLSRRAPPSPGVAALQVDQQGLL